MFFYVMICDILIYNKHYIFLVAQCVKCTCEILIIILIIFVNTIILGVDAREIGNTREMGEICKHDQREAGKQYDWKLERKSFIR